jgi:peptide/nickel transport system permease protein
LLPGNPVLLYISQDQYATITPEELAAVSHHLGLDKSIAMQYLHWVGGVVHGDFGESIFSSHPVAREIVRALPITLHLGITAWIFSHLISIPVGIVCAVRRGKWIDTLLTVLANLGITAPSFWVALIMIYFFGLYLNWLPIYGYTSPTVNFWLSTKKLIMPVFCLGLFSLAGGVRLTRSCMLEVIKQDYMRTAWSKGLSERTILLKHALKNAAIPLVTSAGMSIPMLLGGSAVIETVFAISGMGRLAVDALFARDYPIVQGVILIMAVAVVLSNLLVDVSYGWLDPRIRYD